MKYTIFVPFVWILLSCNNKPSDRTANHEETSKVDSIKEQDTLATVKNYSVPVQVKAKEASKMLIGDWALKGSENPTFEITKDSFYYPEHSSSYKYKVVDDSIKIKYDDYDASFAFKFKGNNILVLTGDDGENVYKRLK